MVDENFQLSKDAFGDIIDKWTNRSAGEKLVLFGTAAMLGTCWGFSKICFWSVRRKTRRKIEEERENLRKRKEELYQELKNDKVREPYGRSWIRYRSAELYVNQWRIQDFPAGLSTLKYPHHSTLKYPQDDVRSNPSISNIYLLFVLFLRN